MLPAESDRRTAKTVTSDHATVRYWIYGDANLPWLIATDGAGLDHTFFGSLTNHLQEHFRVLVWDIPGHGESKPLAGAFTLTDTVTALERILNTEQIDSAVFLGFSFGGLVHQLLSVRQPAVFRAMILYACLCPTIQRMPIPTWLVKPMIWMMFGRPSWDKARALFAKQSSGREGVRRQIDASLERTGRDTFLMAAREMMIAASQAIPMRWTAPTLFIYGAQDAHKKNFAGMLQQLRHTIPTAVIETIEGATHAAHADEPLAFNRSLDRFLESI